MTEEGQKQEPVKIDLDVTPQPTVTITFDGETKVYPVFDLNHALRVPLARQAAAVAAAQAADAEDGDTPVLKALKSEKVAEAVASEQGAWDNIREILGFTELTDLGFPKMTEGYMRQALDQIMAYVSRLLDPKNECEQPQN
jgi:hypothetical protein